MPTAILERCYEQAINAPLQVHSATLRGQIEVVSRNLQNRAGVRLLMACALAKLHQPSVDIRKPYTEIDGTDTFSGRTYDERYIGPFVEQYHLPCNTTTAFLTPAFRNRNTVLSPGLDLVGRPKAVYDAVLGLLQAVYVEEIDAETLLVALIHELLLLRDERADRLQSQLKDLSQAAGTLSATQVLTLIVQHLAFKHASRLPVLVIAAIYRTLADKLGETFRPLEAHNAADRQTQASGDLEITLIHAPSEVVTVYEIKAKRVTVYDIDLTLNKVLTGSPSVENILFITTDEIDDTVRQHAESSYSRYGVEVTVLDCVGFLRHFLHLFYRHRIDFLNHYQDLLLIEPDSAVNQALKEAWLALRIVAETDGFSEEL